VAKLTISLLGNILVSLDGKAVTHFESVKVTALLAYLAAEAGRPQRRGAVAGLLWPDWPEEAASKNLRHTLYSLRKALGDPPCLEADRQMITLIPGEDCRVDVIELEASLDAALADRQLRSAVERLEQVVEQIGGGFLDGFTLDDSPAYEEWVLGRRAHHNQQVLEALGLLADWHEQASAYYRAEIFARRELEIEAWREEAYRQLMRVLALQGKRSQALAQYETCKKILQDGLATQPGEETTWLYEQIRRGLFPPEQVRHARVPVSLPAEAPHNLPQPLTHFIGRVEIIARLKAWLAEYRLVTIAGPGGVGKTRLAMQVAEGVAGRYEYGVYFIDLAVVREPDMMIPAVIKSLGIYTEGSRSFLKPY
jgi:DNA-binding SARP family transcriptional activator